MSRSTTVRGTAHELPRRAVAAGVGLLLLLPLTGSASAAEQVRTETGLGGYRVNATGAPLQILLDDPTIPLPRPPDAAVLEADPSYTSTTLSTGPQGRAVASTLWPGALIGDGTGVITGGATDYPLKADATFPGGTPTAESTGLKASAQGLDVVATANSGAPAQDDKSPLRTGNAQSRSASTVVKDVGIGTVVSEASDVDLLGLIQVRSVRTTLTTRSDGRKGTTEGETVVSGLTINGVGYTVDEKGVRPVDGGKPGTPVVPALGSTPKELADAGIRVEPVGQAETKDGSTVSRVAKGLRITVDSVALRAALNSLPTSDALGELCGSLPTVLPPPAPSVQGNCFYALSATPKITFVLAAGSTSSAANLPLTFAFPPLAPPTLPTLPGPVPVTGAAPTAGAVLGSAPLVAGDAGGVPTTSTGSAPAAGGTALVPVSAPREVPPGFAGIFAGLVIAALVAAGVGARGLAALRALAFAGAAALGKGCLLGAPSDVPDLRGAPA